MSVFSMFQTKLITKETYMNANCQWFFDNTFHVVVYIVFRMSSRLP